MIRFLTDQNPDELILVLSMHDEAVYASRALKAGATAKPEGFGTTGAGMDHRSHGGMQGGKGFKDPQLLVNLGFDARVLPSRYSG